MTKQALVTGGLGFVGTHLVDRLKEEGWYVIVVDDKSTRPLPVVSKADHTYTNTVQSFAYAAGDFKFDAVFHLAGKVGPVGVLRHAGHIAKDTVDAALGAAAFARASGCPLIDISTSEVYGDDSQANTENGPKIIRNASPRAEYAASKLAAEIALLNTEGLDVRIIRPFNITGPVQSPRGGFVLPRFAIQALTEQDITVYGAGSQVRAFTHVTDIVDGIYLAWAEGVRGGIYNLCAWENKKSIEDIALMVQGIAKQGYDKEAKIVHVNPKDLYGYNFEEAPDKWSYAEKAREELGWEPKFGVVSIVRSVLGYWDSMIRTHPEWASL